MCALHFLCGNCDLLLKVIIILISAAAFLSVWWEKIENLQPAVDDEMEKSCCICGSISYQLQPVCVCACVFSV